MLTETIEGLQAILTSRIAAEAENVLINASFGIAPVTRTDSSTDINNAGLAARQAASAGTRWTVFTEDMGDRNGYIQRVLTGLDDALASGRYLSVAAAKMVDSRPSKSSEPKRLFAGITNTFGPDFTD